MEDHGRKEQPSFPWPDKVMVIRGDRFYIGDYHKVSFKVDPACNPKLLDITVLSEEVASREKTRKGIYRIDGDTMVWCWNWRPKMGSNERPPSFDTQKGGVTALHYIRVKR